VREACKRGVEAEAGGWLRRRLRFDADRLAALRAAQILDTEPDEQFDELTRLAATLLDAPVSALTIVSDDRTWAKSAIGMPADQPLEFPVEATFCNLVVRGQAAFIVTDAAADERVRDHFQVSNLGVRAWAGFPVLAPGGETIGSFCVFDVREREWSDRELTVLRSLATSATRAINLRIAIEDGLAGRARAEALVSTLQQSLLPPKLPVVPGMDVAAIFHAAGSGLELVGDFYDLFKANNEWCFVVGDVCGKGIIAAKAASFARWTIGADAMQSDDPAQVMEQLNRTFSERRDSLDLFLTAIYGTFVVTERGCSVRLVSAGHILPVVKRADGSAAEVAVSGTAIGVFSTLDLVEVKLELGPGDALVIFTDGVTEARRGATLLGEGAVLELIRRAPQAEDAVSLA